MLKFSGEKHDGKYIYLLGLNRDSINNIISGQPIKVNLLEFDGPDLDIVIVFGETDQMLFNELKSHGLIPPEVRYQETEPGLPRKVMMRQGKPVNEG